MDHNPNPDLKNVQQQPQQPQYQQQPAQQQQQPAQQQQQPQYQQQPAQQQQHHCQHEAQVVYYQQNQQHQQIQRPQQPQPQLHHQHQQHYQQGVQTVYHQQQQQQPQSPHQQQHYQHEAQIAYQQRPPMEGQQCHAQPTAFRDVPTMHQVQMMPAQSQQSYISSSQPTIVSTGGDLIGYTTGPMQTISSSSPYSRPPSRYTQASQSHLSYHFQTLPPHYEPDQYAIPTTAPHYHQPPHVTHAQNQQAINEGYPSNYQVNSASQHHQGQHQVSLPTIQYQQQSAPGSASSYQLTTQYQQQQGVSGHESHQQLYSSSSQASQLQKQQQQTYQPQQESQQQTYQPQQESQQQIYQPQQESQQQTYQPQQESQLQTYQPQQESQLQTYQPQQESQQQTYQPQQDSQQHHYGPDQQLPKLVKQETEMESQMDTQFEQPEYSHDQNQQYLTTEEIVEGGGFLDAEMQGVDHPMIEQETNQLSHQSSFPHQPYQRMSLQGQSRDLLISQQHQEQRQLQLHSQHPQQQQLIDNESQYLAPRLQPQPQSQQQSMHMHETPSHYHQHQSSVVTPIQHLEQSAPIQRQACTMSQPQSLLRPHSSHQSPHAPQQAQARVRAISLIERKQPSYQQTIRAARRQRSSTTNAPFPDASRSSSGAAPVVVQQQYSIESMKDIGKQLTTDQPHHSKEQQSQSQLQTESNISYEIHQAEYHQLQPVTDNLSRSGEQQQTVTDASSTKQQVSEKLSVSGQQHSVSSEAPATLTAPPIPIAGPSSQSQVPSNRSQGYPIRGKVFIHGCGPSSRDKYIPNYDTRGQVWVQGRIVEKLPQSQLQEEEKAIVEEQQSSRINLKKRPFGPPNSNSHSDSPQSQKSDQVEVVDRSKLPRTSHHFPHPSLLVAMESNNQNNDESSIVASFRENPSLVMVYEPDDIRNWCTILYYEYGQRFGDQFIASEPVINIDGYTATSSSRFCLGQIANINRRPRTERVRQYILQGMRLSYDISQGEVSCECLTRSIFLQSQIYNGKMGRDLTAVTKLVTNERIVIFDDRVFAEELSRARGHAEVFALTHACKIRISFIKGWGTGYHSQCITSTPCWIEILLIIPLRWADLVLRYSGQPSSLVSSSLTY